MGDVLIRSGRLVTAEKDFTADILIHGESISAVGENLSAPAGAEIIDAAGLLLIPGGVDAHTHVDLSVGDAHVSDGWLAGTKAAAYGGTTTIIEHPGFGPDGCPIDFQLKKYYENAVEAVIDYGLHGVFQRWSKDVANGVPPLVNGGYPSFKAYLTYDGRLSEAEFLEACLVLGQCNGLMTVHAENHAVVSHLGAEYRKKDPHNASSHPNSRPAYAESLAVHEAICLARAADAPLYIVHLSTSEGLEIIRRARAQGHRVWAETCPQYLLLTDACYQQGFDQALKFVMSPPPRKQADVDALWKGLLDGSISVVATDHCSFAWDEKKRRAQDNIFKSPGGIPGIETRVPLLYSEGVLKRGMSLSRWVELVSTAPARIFGLEKKGELKPGFDADVVLFNPECEKVLTAGHLHQAVDYTPYENITVRGWPQTVFLRGRKIIDGERFIGEPGAGRFIARQPFTAGI